ncbi:glycine zipper domain-containing protein [Ancylobacter sp. 6x-1]|uniref:Glycine zipper domain-containing protein n=1 Tax=Ancylobacter crimeensis TaxID=2579147 RepID=A0ABT0D8R4_9HYPH|nr:glycine zipper domain-containing protein [Ancylobacter crimeensis]MCK0196332.1 glycine zipper domain-containing protein [Ancylobacter crimeensis]
MRAYKIVAVGLVGLSLAACASNGGNPNTMLGSRTADGAAIGAVTGGVIGQLAGRSTAATLIGVAAGGLIGGMIGNSLDQQDRARAAQAEQQALENGAPGAPVSWRGDSGNYGTIVAGPAYARGPSPRCREYTHTIYISGQPQTARGTACRNPDGTWTSVAG